MARNRLQICNFRPSFKKTTMNIVVTGASSGVGFEAVLELIMNSNNQVVALARSAEKLKTLYDIAKGLNPDCTLYSAQFDIVHDDYPNGLVPFIKERIKKVDILINNAGALINKPFM